MPRPYLIVRASIDPAVMAEFVCWYEQEHLPHVLQIPGVLRAFRTHCRHAATNWTALYELKDEDAIQRAFASDEAGRARQDWQRWLPHVSELTVDVYAPLGPLANYHHWD